MTRARKLVALVGALLACSAAVALPVSAAQSQVVADCNAHGHLTGHYSSAQLRNSLSTMSADVKEYTNCYDVIQRALLAQLGASHAGSGSPAGSQSSSGSFLPTPVVVVLVLLVLGAAGFAVLAVRRRGPGDGPGSAVG
jgi:hypothetical protein